MSYFFPITAELVSAPQKPIRSPRDSRDSAIERTPANTANRGIAEIATASDFDSAFWRDYFEERAAIREHDGGLSRADAEAGALTDCVARWRAFHRLPASGDGACVHCGKPGPDTPVLARGGHAWLHRGCWAAMNAVRERETRRAVLEALTRHGEQVATGATTRENRRTKSLLKRRRRR